MQVTLPVCLNFQTQLFPNIIDLTSFVPELPYKHENAHAKDDQYQRLLFSARFLPQHHHLRSRQ